MLKFRLPDEVDGSVTDPPPSIVANAPLQSSSAALRHTATDGRSSIPAWTRCGHQKVCASAKNDWGNNRVLCQHNCPVIRPCATRGTCTSPSMPGASDQQSFRGTHRQGSIRRLTRPPSLRAYPARTAVSPRPPSASHTSVSTEGFFTPLRVCINRECPATYRIHSLLSSPRIAPQRRRPRLFHLHPRHLSRVTLIHERDRHLHPLQHDARVHLDKLLHRSTIFPCRPTQQRHSDEHAGRRAVSQQAVHPRAVRGCIRPPEPERRKCHPPPAHAIQHYTVSTRRKPQRVQRDAGGQEEDLTRRQTQRRPRAACQRRFPQAARGARTPARGRAGARGMPARPSGRTAAQAAASRVRGGLRFAACWFSGPCTMATCASASAPWGSLRAAVPPLLAEFFESAQNCVF